MNEGRSAGNFESSFVSMMDESNYRGLAGISSVERLAYVNVDVRAIKVAPTLIERDGISTVAQLGRMKFQNLSGFPFYNSVHVKDLELSSILILV